MSDEYKDCGKESANHKRDADLQRETPQCCGDSHGGIDEGNHSHKPIKRGAALMNAF